MAFITQIQCSDTKSPILQQSKANAPNEQAKTSEETNVDLFE